MFVLKQVHEKKIKNKIKELWKKIKMQLVSSGNWKSATLKENMPPIYRRTCGLIGGLICTLCRAPLSSLRFFICHIKGYRTLNHEHLSSGEGAANCTITFRTKIGGRRRVTAALALRFHSV